METEKLLQNLSYTSDTTGFFLTNSKCNSFHFFIVTNNTDTFLLLTKPDIFLWFSFYFVSFHYSMDSQGFLLFLFLVCLFFATSCSFCLQIFFGLLMFLISFPFLRSIHDEFFFTCSLDQIGTSIEVTVPEKPSRTYLIQVLIWILLVTFKMPFKNY